MRIHNKQILTGYSLTLCLAFIGCGGGGTTTSPTIPTTTYKVSGTVPGTLIEAFCKDGSYYSVNSTDNGTSKHPFDLTLPSSIDCKLVMTTNEKDVDTTKRIITPLSFNNGTTNSSYIKLSKDLNLSNIPLSLTGQGVQSPLTLSLSNQGVELNSFATDPLDSNNDGVPNVYEDDDADGIVNRYDNDDNGDGILDTQDPTHSNDIDGDGIVNSLDVDNNNDGIRDTESSTDNNNGSTDTGSSTDNNNGSTDTGSSTGNNNGSTDTESSTDNNNGSTDTESSNG